MRIKAALLILLSLYVPFAFADSQAYTDGQAAGNSALGSTAGSVTQSNSDSLGTSFGGNVINSVAPLAAMFAVSNQGNSGLSSQGQQQMTTCQNLPPNSTPQMQQFCAGVNALAKNPIQNAQTVTGITKNDPMFTNQNNMFNQGVANAGNTNATVGTGTPQNGINGASACGTSPTTSPVSYTTSTCTRAAGATTQPCQIVIAPTVTSTPYCNISGSAMIISANPAGVLAPGGAGTGQAFFSITYGCVNSGTGSAWIQPYVPGWNTGYGTWSIGGGTNIGWYGSSVSFVPGFSTNPVGWWCGINYDGTLLNYCTAWYDGPSDSIRIQVGANALGGSPVSCDPTYSWNTSLSGSGTSYGMQMKWSLGKLVYVWGSAAASFSSSQYCTLSTDATSLVVAGPTPVIPSPCPAGSSAILKNATTGECLQTTCARVGTKTTCTSTILSTFTPTGSLCPPGWSTSSAGVCTNGAGRYVFAYSPAPIGTCDTNHTYMSLGNVGYCFPNNDHWYNFGWSSPHYSGTCGVKHTLSENITNTCLTLQQQTANPTAYPATAVNGVYTCPTGKTLSGTFCI